MRHGFTLIELVAVVAILSIIALLAVSRVTEVSRRAKVSAAERDLATIRDAFVSNDGGYLRDMSGIPGFSLGYLRIANLMIATNLYGSVADGGVYSSGFRVDDPNRSSSIAGCAAPAAFTQWDDESGRGWRGPYVNSWTGEFPSESDVRFPADSTFGSRGFFPPVDGLREPEAFLRGEGGCSIYGFPGEPAVMDPWATNCPSIVLTDLVMFPRRSCAWMRRLTSTWKGSLEPTDGCWTIAGDCRAAGAARTGACAGRAKPMAACAGTTASAKASGRMHFPMMLTFIFLPFSYFHKPGGGETASPRTALRNIV